MKNFCIKLLAVTLCACFFLLGMPCSVSAAFNHHPYWALQAAYNTAISSGDEEAIVKACEGIINLYASFPDATASYRVEVPVLQAAAIYEKRGQYQDALRMYRIYKDCLAAQERLAGEDVRERLLFAEAFIDAYAYIEPTVYVYADNPSDVPYYQAKNEPKTGTYTGMCFPGGKDYDESLNNGYLLYALFEEESFRNFDWILPKMNSYYLLEAAWNIPTAYTEKGAIEYFNGIANGSFDSYIISELKYLNGLNNCGVLLRFGAEVNIWGVNSVYKESGQLEEFKKSFIDAFRHIHDMAEKHAPKVAMVYSPNDLSSMYVTMHDFYPGDDYVDWVGCSSYGDLYGPTTWQHASMTDAYYKTGVYENHMIKIMELVRTYGDRKPILISECGFMYRSSKSTQTEEHAKKAMEFFYSYINMVYPQVKAVFYFNTNFAGDNYCLFGAGQDPDNPALAAVYTESIHGNPVISDTLAGKTGGYTRLETLRERRKDLTLSVFAAYPGNPAMQVTYIADGKSIAVTDTIPYTCTITADLLKTGKHTLEVETSVKGTVYTSTFDIYVESDGTVWAEKFTHKGGVATCTEKAICEICHQPYGEANPQNHAASSAWITSDGKHYHTCQNGCGAQFDAANCTGGTATCVEKAKCSICGQYYGNFASHVPAAEYTWQNGQHYHRCLTAGCTQTFDVTNCTDADKDHTCDVCRGTVGMHEATEKSHLCTYCGKVVSDCADTDKNHKCDVCDTDMGEHKAPDGAHICAYCEQTISDCTDTDKNHKCDVCNADMGEHKAPNGAHICAYCEQTISDCTDTDKNHKCDVCNADMGAHEAPDGTHICAYCEQTISDCTDENKDNKCDICGTALGITETKTNTPDTTAATSAAAEKNESAKKNTDDNTDTQIGGPVIIVGIIIAAALLGIVTAITLRKKKR